MSSPPDDDPFGLGDPPSPPAPARRPGPEARKEARINVKWPARVQMPDGRVVELRLCDISETGVGLLGQAPLSANATLRCAIAVPDVNHPERHTVATGTMRTAHVTVRGNDLVYGGIWVELDSTGREAIRKWIRKK